MDRRLQRRFVKLVRAHMHAATELAAGVASLPDVGSAFAATQGAWRFLNNGRITLAALVEPLRAVGQSRCSVTKCKFAMLVHDWSKLSYHGARKRDLTQLTHKTDVGYELTTALLVSADDGRPLAPMEVHLRTAKGMLSTRAPAPPVQPHLEQVLPTMEASATWGLSKPLLHVIDREADSVDHLRRWNAAGHAFLVRGDDRRVRWKGVPSMLREITAKLRRKQAFQHVGEALFQGQPAELWVAETEVVLDRPAKKNVRNRRFQLAGEPLPLRYVVAQVRSEQGRALGTWMLLSNAPSEWASGEQLARCYYWRWGIESFFKLLKSHGQQLEHWEQQTGAAIARRLLVAAMACVVVWQLHDDESPRAVELKRLLVRLSGRQMKRHKPYTRPALLCGIWTLLAMLATLEQFNLQEIRKLAAAIPYLNSA
jgi:hypothetical protein